MAKKNNANTAEDFENMDASSDAPSAEVKALQQFLDENKASFAESAPEGFIEQSDDIIGTWIPATAIQGIVQGANLMDSNIESDKPAALIFISVTKPCIVEANVNDNKEYRVAKEGDLVGIWYKAGMRALRHLGGKEVWIKVSGEKDTGKPNPMITYNIKSKERGSLIRIGDDRRLRSKPVPGPDGKMQKLHAFDRITESQELVTTQSDYNGQF